MGIGASNRDERDERSKHVKRSGRHEEKSGFARKCVVARDLRGAAS